jgi:hypothetical protein
MRKQWLLFSYSILILSIGFVNSAYAQAQTDTRTGCLMKSSKTGTYFLVDEVTGRRLEIQGAGLDKLTEGGTQSQIRVTGAVAIENGKEIFKATDITQTRAICAPIAYNPDALKSEIGRARFGARAGVALDPELVVFGGQAQFGPIFKQIWFRPTAEYEFGEISRIFNANGEAIFFIPSSGVGQTGHMNIYAGGGLGFNLVRQHFSGFPGQGDSFEDTDWSTDFGLNLVVGFMKNSGLFAEVRTSVWMEPTIRLYVGYVFH